MRKSVDAECQCGSRISPQRSKSQFDGISRTSCITVHVRPVKVDNKLFGFEAETIVQQLRGERKFRMLVMDRMRKGSVGKSESNNLCRRDAKS
jgi:hypothetical protein